MVNERMACNSEMTTDGNGLGDRTARNFPLDVQLQAPDSQTFDCLRQLAWQVLQEIPTIAQHSQPDQAPV